MVDPIRQAPPPPPPPPPKPKEIHKQLQQLQAEQAKGPQSADHTPPDPGAQDKAAGRITKDTLETTGDPTMKSIADKMGHYDQNHNGLDANEFEKAFNDASPLTRNDAQQQPDERVMKMQQDINKANKAQEGDENFVKEDGYFGPKTEGAVKAYQQQQGIEPSGRADGDTMEKLNPPKPVDNAESAPPADGAGSKPGDAPDAGKPPEAKGDPNLQPKPADQRAKPARNDVAEDLDKARNMDPNSKDFAGHMKDAIKGLDEDNLRHDDNRQDMRAIRDEYAAAADKVTDPKAKADFQSRAKIFNDMAEAQHFDSGTAHDLVQALQDGDATNQDLNDAMDNLKDDKSASPEMMRAMGETMKLVGSKDYDNNGVNLDLHGAKDQAALGDALIAAGGPKVSTEVRNNIRLGLTDNDDTSNDYNRAVDAAAKGECGLKSVDDLNALKAFAASKPGTFKNNEVGRIDGLAKHFDQLPDAAKGPMIQSLKGTPDEAYKALDSAYAAATNDKERAAVKAAIADQPSDRSADWLKNHPEPQPPAEPAQGRPQAQ